MAKNRIERGDIWQYRFAPPDKRRPVLIISRPIALKHLSTAMVAPITGTIRELPSEVRVGTDNGLKKESAVNLDHILTVRQSDLRKFIGHLDEDRMHKVCEAAQIALGCI